MTLAHEAVILAAGRGSRISSETADLPKALLPIGPRARGGAEPTCFLRRQCELLIDLGVDPIVVVVGWLGDLIRAEVARWGGDRVRIVTNPSDIATSGSLHSFQFAARSAHGILDGTRQTWLLDADIVYHRRVLEESKRAAGGSSLLVAAEHRATSEEVIVYGTRERPRFIGKGLTPELVQQEPPLGEAMGIVSFAPADHALVRRSMDWMLGDPDAPPGSLAERGFGPARRATEHEELSARFMMYGLMKAVVVGPELPFMEVDTVEEYGYLRDTFYPRLLELEATP